MNLSMTAKRFLCLTFIEIYYYTFYTSFTLCRGVWSPMALWAANVRQNAPCLQNTAVWQFWGSEWTKPCWTLINRLQNAVCWSTLIGHPFENAGLSRKAVKETKSPTAFVRFCVKAFIEEFRRCMTSWNSSRFWVVADFRYLSVKFLLTFLNLFAIFRMSWQVNERCTRLLCRTVSISGCHDSMKDYNITIPWKSDRHIFNRLVSEPPLF